MNENPAPARHYDLSALSMVVTDEMVSQYLADNGGLRSHVDIRKSSIFVVAFFGIVFVLPSLFSSQQSGSWGSVIFIVLFIVGLGIAYIVTMRKIAKTKAIRTLKISAFAAANNLQYTQTSTAVTNESGMFFNVGEGQTLNDIIRSDAESKEFEFGNYTYVTGSGKNRQIHKTGFLRIGLDRDLPQMVLDGQKNNTHLLGMDISNLPVDFKKNQKMNLEGDFNKYFQLYAPADYERDALYVFTPDLMALFIDNASVYDAEIVDHWLYVYTPELDMANPLIIGRLFSIIATVGKKTINQTDHYQDDRAVAAQGQTVAPDGRRLKRGVSTFGIVVGVIIVLFNFGPVIQVVYQFFKGFFGGSH